MVCAVEPAWTVMGVFTTRTFQSPLKGLAYVHHSTQPTAMASFYGQG
jgi:hypothetical protein